MISLFLIPSLSFPQGLFTNFEKLVKGQKSKYSKLTDSLLNQTFSPSETEDINKVRIDPEYINLLLQNTPSRYTLLATNDRCSLYDLMQTDLLKSPNGPIKNVIINYLDKKKVKQKRLLSKDKFLRLVAYKQCPKIKQFKEYFSPQNARNTLQNIKISPPTSKTECRNLFKRFRTDVKTPYLCQMVETIRERANNKKALGNLASTDYRARADFQKKVNRADSYNKILSKRAKDLLVGLCLNINTPQNYCFQYFEKSFWTGHFKQNEKSPILKSFCKGINKRKCINNLNNSPGFCEFAGSMYPALFPKPNCQQISKALLKSQLNLQENDCPGKVGNEAVTTFSRILNSKDNLGKKEYSCEVNATYAFAKMTEELSDYDAWKVNLCFLNKLNGNKKECYPTIYGKIGDEKISLPNVVKKIASRTRGFKEGECSVTQKKDYKPSLLKFRNGCHIILNDQNCTSTGCKIKVVIDEVEFKQVIQENFLDFNLFPYDFINENKSLIKLYTKAKKLILKTVKNMSNYKFVKEQHPKAQFIGVGCAEDLLPSFFKRISFNSCSPLPFITDGFFESSGSYSLVVRSGIDQIHAPRILPWPYIFNAVKTYQRLHPIKLWGLYAIY